MARDLVTYESRMSLRIDPKVHFDTPAAARQGLEPYDSNPCD